MLKPSGSLLNTFGFCDLFVCSHDEMRPLLHRPGAADLSVGDVGGDEAQQALQKDLRTVVHVILLRGQFCQVVLGTQM